MRDLLPDFDKSRADGPQVLSFHTRIARATCVPCSLILTSHTPAGAKRCFSHTDCLRDLRDLFPDFNKSRSNVCQVLFFHTRIARVTCVTCFFD